MREQWTRQEIAMQDQAAQGGGGVEGQTGDGGERGLYFDSVLIFIYIFDWSIISPQLN